MKTPEQNQFSGDEISHEKLLREKLEQVALNTGDSLDADRKLRFKTLEEANAFQELASELGLEVEIREPRPHYPGITQFAKLIANLYEVYPVSIKTKVE
ncbi:hypothetical protein L0Y69_01610 [bacterium]|nr:hypothetical protein [bacterium]